ncbi:MAG: YbhB/YbcL family Raf kinase inhibitor-like protein [Candidatus Micrarchaeota archaeon]
MKVESPAFGNGAPIPKKYTCEGGNISPPLAISGVPENAKSLALVCDDRDAPMGTFVHWVAWKLPSSLKGIMEGAKLPGVEGTNDFGRAGYGGPCPPRGHGPHRYSFRLYALDTQMNLRPGASRHELERAMEGHVLENAELIGTYERK